MAVVNSNRVSLTELTLVLNDKERTILRGMLQNAIDRDESDEERVLRKQIFESLGTPPSSGRDIGDIK